MHELFTATSYYYCPPKYICDSKETPKCECATSREKLEVILSVGVQLKTKSNIYEAVEHLNEATHEAASWTSPEHKHVDIFKKLPATVRDKIFE